MIIVIKIIDGARGHLDRLGWYAESIACDVAFLLCSTFFIINHVILITYGVAAGLERYEMHGLIILEFIKEALLNN